MCSRDKNYLGKFHSLGFFVLTFTIMTTTQNFLLTVMYVENALIIRL